MGTVLLRKSGLSRYPRKHWFQSPSRWGRCCFQTCAKPLWVSAFVSVPFSMGTVLLQALDDRQCVRFRRFSPLLDGDGVASRGSRSSNAALPPVSVPFSMGTVLLLDAAAPAPEQSLRFQSPSRWGRCCFCGIAAHRTKTFSVSVPFSMGTVLLQGGRRVRKNRCARFSPLLDGDGVASPSSSSSSR